MKVQVTKRNGQTEDFDQDKIARVVTAAGLKPQEGFDLATKVAQWVQNLKKPQVTSYQIRERVIEELRKVNPITADLFVQYEKTKDKNLNSGEFQSPIDG